MAVTSTKTKAKQVEAFDSMLCHITSFYTIVYDDLLMLRHCIWVSIDIVLNSTNIDRPISNYIRQSSM